MRSNRTPRRNAPPAASPATQPQRAPRPAVAANDAPGQERESGTPRALVIDPDAASAQVFAAVLKTLGLVVEFAASAVDAASHSDLHELDLALIEHRAADASVVTALASRLREHEGCGRLLAYGHAPGAAEIVQIVRAGAADFLLLPCDAAEVEKRCRAALDLVAADRARRRREQGLRAVCQRMNETRLDLTGQVDSLCNDLVSAYQGLADQITHVTTVTEFAAVIRQELDVEELLRTTLEYLLRKMGPMNAAVFLPSVGDEFTLGAYINYDCGKDAADFLLEHLTDVIAPRMARETGLREFKSNEDLHAWMGDDGAWLADAHVLCFSCRHDDECLAIFTLWRDAQTPFGEDLVATVSSLADVFARQIAHVIHIHHRHLPDEGDAESGTAGGLAA